MRNIEARMLRFLDELEGKVSNLSLDKGGWTYRGLSSRYFPEIVDMYHSGDPELDSYVDSVYLNKYMRNIYGYSELITQLPWLFKLLVPAKVHGSGDEHLVSVIQGYLNREHYHRLAIDGQYGPQTHQALLSLSVVEQDNLITHIKACEGPLATLRADSVAAYRVSIIDRVRREHLNAFDNVLDYSTVDSDVVQTANLSIISYPNATVEETSNGWEDLPLGLGLTIEIRKVANASDTVSSERSLS